MARRPRPPDGKRSIEEVERNLQTEMQIETENKRSKEDWQALVKNDNNVRDPCVKQPQPVTAMHYVIFGTIGNAAIGRMSRTSDRTHQGHCHHCDRMRQPLRLGPFG
jgi:hypothetical protein